MKPRTAAPSSDVAFTESVKRVQSLKGSREAYARMEIGGGFETLIDDNLAHFIGAQTSTFLATANATGQPYIQHRGGPRGFLKVLDPSTIAFADFRGNRQYITTGNLLENPRAHLFLIDYARRQRVKVWGTARVTEERSVLDALTPANYDARVEQAIVFSVQAWDANCPQHIPQRFDASDVRALIEAKDSRIAELEAALAASLGAAKSP